MTTATDRPPTLGSTRSRRPPPVPAMQRTGGIAQAREIEALIEVDEGVFAPDLLADFIPSDDLAAPCREHGQNPQRLGA